MATTKQLHGNATRNALLVALTVSTGAVDAISWLALDKVFSAFMTGNLALVGIAMSGAAGPPLLRAVTSLAAFAVGAAVGGRMVSPTEQGGLWPRRATVALGIAVLAEAAFLAVWLGVDGRPSTSTGHGLIAMSAFAMGVQTATIFSLGVRAVFTTAATATWAALMGDLTHWSRSRDEGRLLALVITALVGGAVAGGFLIAHARAWAPVLPLVLGAAIVAVAALSFRRSPVSQRR